MANKMAKVVVVGLIAVGPAASASAQSDQPPTVGVYLSDPQETMGARDREGVQPQVLDVYAKAGVQIEWGSSARATASDRRRHLELVMLGIAAAERQVPQRQHVGIAIRAAGRAYICHDRIVAHAFRAGGNPSRALALVIVHGLAHLLLPGSSHAPTGLMRADWNGSVRRIPEFTPSQAETLRAKASDAP